MQKWNFSRVIVLLTALVLCISLCTVTAFASETEETVPTFVLCFDTGEGVQYYSAFCVQSAESVYLVSAAEAGAMAQTGCDALLVGIGYSEEVTLLKTVGQVSYFRAPGLESIAAYALGTEFPGTVVISALVEEEGERYVGLSDPLLMDEGWKDQGSYYLSENDILEDTVLMGAPVLTADGTQVVGMVSRNSEMALVILPMVSHAFPSDATVVSVPSAPAAGAPAEEETQDPTGEAETEGTGETGEAEEPEDGKKPISTNMLLIGGGVLILLAVIVAANRKPKKKASEPAYNPTPAADPYRNYSDMGGTIPLKRNEMVSELVDIQPTAPLRRPAAPVTAKWQLRCVRGPLEGRVYPLNDKLSIGRMQDNDIVFAENTKGVSGRHCEVQISGEQVILQDLNATYGTYFGMEQKAKLKPNMDYTLKNGDVFILAEGGPAFRLEQIGSTGKKPGFTVRSAGGTLYRSNGDGEITFGRNPECVVAFDQGNSAVSGKHCKLFMKEDGLYLMDQGSTNGTYFAENQRLKPNVSYKVVKGAGFFLVNPRNAFVITEE